MVLLKQNCELRQNTTWRVLKAQQQYTPVVHLGPNTTKKNFKSRYFSISSDNFRTVPLKLAGNQGIESEKLRTVLRSTCQLSKLSNCSRPIILFFSLQ